MRRELTADDAKRRIGSENLSARRSGQLLGASLEVAGQVVERIVKSESGLQRDTLMPVRFVPLVTGALPVLGQG